MMNGKLFVMGAPAVIFDSLEPEWQARLEYVDSFLQFPKGRWRQLTRWLVVGRLPLPRRCLYAWFPQQGLDHLLQATAADRVLLYECANYRMLKAVRQLLPRTTVCFIYYCNPIRTLFGHPERELAAIARLGFRLSTFDPDDARRYGLELTGQYFCHPARLPEGRAATTDCFFCGLPKDRQATLDRLRRRLEEAGLVCDFIIPTTAGEKIGYDEYLRRLSRARCVVDICQQGQRGLTRRPLEALFYDKKLITDNPMIRTYDFYNPENILIFGEDSADALKAFVRQPLSPVPRAVKDRYDVRQWLRRYME